MTLALIFLRVKYLLHHEIECLVFCFIKYINDYAVELLNLIGQKMLISRVNHTFFNFYLKESFNTINAADIRGVTA